MKVLIVGASGGTGRQLVSQALERGWQVTALVRDLRRLAIEHERLRLVVGDVLQPDSLDGAMANQEAVLSALGHKRWFYPNSILSRGTFNLLAAMEKAGVRRFICQSSLGVGDSFGRMGIYYTLFVIPIILPWYFWDKLRQERIIKASSMDWTIVRPAVLTNKPARGQYRTGSDVGHWIITRKVTRADVAGFTLDLIDQPATFHTVIAIAS